MSDLRPGLRAQRGFQRQYSSRHPIENDRQSILELGVLVR
jgi:hypothetical protein